MARGTMYDKAVPSPVKTNRALLRWPSPSRAYCKQEPNVFFAADLHV
jgi:hypothetical protein